MEISAGFCQEAQSLSSTVKLYKGITYFSNSPLDRQSEFRKNKKYITQCLKSDRALFILYNKQVPLMKEIVPKFEENFNETKYYKMAESYVLETLCFSEAEKIIQKFGEDFENPLTIYLGVGGHFLDDVTVYHSGSNVIRNAELEDKYFWFAVDITGMELTDALKEHFPRSAFFKPRPSLLMMKEGEASINALGRSILAWHERYSFCPTCGNKTSVQDAGFKRWCSNEECPSREGVHNTCFPRLDPTVIMVITSPDHERLLLGRKKMFYKGLYSCLAGFMEPGETIEEAVRREVHEESGIVVGEVKYVFSQPWPFPSVLMIGCFGEALTEDITVCAEELEDVQWFDKAVVHDALMNMASAGDPFLIIPPGQTIAHQLMKHWCKENGLINVQCKM